MGEVKEMYREFVELQSFINDWYYCGLTDDDLFRLESYLNEYPDSGDIIPGTDGLRKLRWKMKNSGKRGGVRTIYIDFVSYEKIYFITAYTKKMKEDLTMEEKSILRKLVKSLSLELKGE